MYNLRVIKSPTLKGLLVLKQKLSKIDPHGAQVCLEKCDANLPSTSTRYDSSF